MKVRVNDRREVEVRCEVRNFGSRTILLSAYPLVSISGRKSAEGDVLYPGRTLAGGSPDVFPTEGRFARLGFLSPWPSGRGLHPYNYYHAVQQDWTTVTSYSLEGRLVEDGEPATVDQVDTIDCDVTSGYWNSRSETMEWIRLVATVRRTSDGNWSLVEGR